MAGPELPFEIWKINWDIKNFTYLRTKFPQVYCNIKVEGESENQWRMSLYPYSLFDQKTVSLLMVEKQRIGEGEGRISMEYKICLKDCTGKLHASFCDKVTLTNKNNYFMKDLIEVKDLPKLHLLEHDTFCLSFVFLIAKENPVEYQMPAFPFGFSNVSNDLLDLYKRADFWDVLLRFKGTHAPQYIRAHKVILSYRNAVLAQKIENENFNGIIDFAEVDYKTMDKVLQYLYSGNVNSIMNEACMALYECMSFLKIENILETFNITMVTEIQEKECNPKVWMLENFLECKQKLLFGNCCESDLITISELGASWRLSLRIKSESCGSTEVGIFATAVEKEDKVGIVCCEFSILNEKGEKIICNLMEAKNPWEAKVDPFFDLKDCDKYILSNGGLSIQFAVQTFRRYYKNSMIKEAVSSLNVKERLRNDLGRMLMDKKFADTEIAGTDFSAKYHKCILCARSFEFESRLYELNKISLAASYKEIRYFVLHVYGLYGRIPDDISVSALYHLAADFSLGVLVGVCADWLYNHLSVDTLREALRCVALDANSKFKQVVMKFAAVNYENGACDVMEEAKMTSNELYLEFQLYLKRYVSEKKRYELEISSK